MTYSVSDVRNWNTAALAGAGDAVAGRGTEAGEVRRILSNGRESLADGWEGQAADAVLDAVELERSHVTKLADGLEDLADALRRAQAALGPAVQSVRSRIDDAVAVGLEVGDASLRPMSGREDIDQATVDGHAEAINSAVDTVRSLDEHYGREIDEIAARLYQAIPSEVDRSPIPGADSSWLGVGAAAGVVAGGVDGSAARYADDLDPATRGAHAKAPLPDDAAGLNAKRLRVVGKFAGPLGGGLTAYEGLKAHAEGETSASQAFMETGGALGGGVAGGAMAGAAAGSFFGPVGTFVGAGIGAAVGAELGKNTGDWIHGQFFRDPDNEE